MTVRSACSARLRLSSSAFLLAAAMALILPESTDPAAGALLLAIDDDEADCALSFTDLPVLSRTACAARAPTRLMYLRLIARACCSHTKSPTLLFLLSWFVD
uniref:Secreted protein n=1 Tax=Arundo donax TaxID=35708 RepID=A0A0A9AZP8_ARUDO